MGDVGAVSTRAVIAYWLDDGLLIVRVSLTLFAPGIGAALRLRVGADALDACTGAASGTRNSIPDSASSASIVPELNLLIYI